jgi:hypothetical protein
VSLCWVSWQRQQLFAFLELKTLWFDALGIAQSWTKKQNIFHCNSNFTLLFDLSKHVRQNLEFFYFAYLGITIETLCWGKNFKHCANCRYTECHYAECHGSDSSCLLFWNWRHFDLMVLLLHNHGQSCKFFPAVIST